MTTDTPHAPHAGDSLLLKQAVDVLTSAEIVNKFSTKVWISVNRQAWDKLVGDKND